MSGLQKSVQDVQANGGARLDHDVHAGAGRLGQSGRDQIATGEAESTARGFAEYGTRAWTRRFRAAQVRLPERFPRRRDNGDADGFDFDAGDCYAKRGYTVFQRIPDLNAGKYELARSEFQTT